jgi:D-sedoheptulose 7-phosphate isomerase
MKASIARSLADAEGLLREFRADEAAQNALECAGSIIFDCFQRRGRVLCCGNGGSLADAVHFAEEWSGRFRNDRPPYPAIALSDAAHMSCVANDYGFEWVFSRQVEALGHPGDVLLLLSTSGNSPNIVEAAKSAKAQQMQVIGMLGRGGGNVAEFCDVIVHAPGEGSDRIQEIHMLALHALIEAIEERLGHGSTAG